MHSSRMRTARLLTISHSIHWGFAQPPLSADPLPECRPLWMQTPNADPLWMQTPLDADPPGCRPPGHVTVMHAGKSTPCEQINTEV